MRLSVSTFNPVLTVPPGEVESGVSSVRSPQII